MKKAKATRPGEPTLHVECTPKEEAQRLAEWAVADARYETWWYKRRWIGK